MGDALLFTDKTAANVNSHYNSLVFRGLYIAGFYRRCHRPCNCPLQCYNYDTFLPWKHFTIFSNIWTFKIIFQSAFDGGQTITTE